LYETIPVEEKRFSFVGVGDIVNDVIFESTIDMALFNFNQCFEM